MPTKRPKQIGDTVPLPLWLNLSPQQAALGDLLGELLLSLPIRVVVVISLLLHGTLILYEIVVSLGYVQTNRNILTIFDAGEWLQAIPTYLMYGPFVWWFYTWQPRNISMICKRLLAEDFIGNVYHFPKSVRAFQQPGWRKRFVMTTLLIVIVLCGTAIYAWIFPENCQPVTKCFGKTASWLYNSDGFFKFIWAPIFSLDIALLIMIVLRQFALIVSFSRLFRSYYLVPKLFHPDECSGLSFIGGFFIRTAWSAVLICAWIVYLGIYPLLIDAPVQLTPLNWLALFAAAIVLPVFSLIPSFSIHRAMYRARQYHLLPLMDEMNTTVIPAPDQANEIAAKMDIYAHLEQAHVLFPLPLRRITVFALTALVPVILALVSLFFQIARE